MEKQKLLANQIKERKRIQKTILDALKKEKLTVPELANKIGIDSGEIFYPLVCLRQKGVVTEAGKKGDYYLYKILESSEE